MPSTASHCTCTSYTTKRRSTALLLPASKTSPRVPPFFNGPITSFWRCIHGIHNEVHRIFLQHLHLHKKYFLNRARLISTSSKYQHLHLACCNLISRFIRATLFICKVTAIYTLYFYLSFFSWRTSSVSGLSYNIFDLVSNQVLLAVVYLLVSSSDDIREM